MPETDHIPSREIRFSVVIPAFNAEKTLTTCLESLMNQSLDREEYEVIVVDDGSTDSTRNIVDRFQVRYIFQSNRGPAAARNRGAGESIGDIILFTDSDCDPDFRWAEEMLSPFKAYDVIGVKGAYKTRQKELTARFAQAEFEDRFDLLRKSTSIDMVDTYSAAFRKKVFFKMGGFDESFPVANNEDTEFSYRLVAAGHKLVFNPNAFVYHIHPDTFRKYFKNKFWRGYWRIVVYRRFPNKAVKDSYTPAVVKLQTLLMALSFFALIMSLFMPILMKMAIICWAGIISLSTPFSLKTYKKDKIVGLISPIMILIRSLVFACGGLYGMGRAFLDKKGCVS